ncbi:MAG: IS66-like element accessory protein TnpA [Casimicrobium sp.]
MKSFEIVTRERLVVKTKRDGRSVYSRAGKRALIEACARPGASVAAIALAHGINANLLRKWIGRDQAKRAPRAAQKVQATAATLLPVEIASSPPANSVALVSTITPVASASAPTCASLVIEIAGARIVLDGSVDRAVLNTVIDCLRESRAK